MNSRKLIARSVAVALCASFFASSEATPAAYRQARPLSEADGYVPYQIRFRIFREAGSDSYRDARVFYEQLAHPKTDESGHLLSHASDSMLTLYVEVDPDPRIPELIRRYLVTNGKVERGQLPLGNISPLPIVEGWIETSDGALRSLPYGAGAWTTSGELAVHFPLDSGADPADVLLALERNHLQLFFRYSFEGLAESECAARADWTRLRKLDRLRDLAGDGGEGFVTRNQLARIAREVADYIEISTSCMSKKGVELGAEVLALLEDSESPRLDLDEYARLAPEIFRANVRNHVQQIENTEHRDQIQHVFENIMADAIEGGLSLRVIIEKIPVLANLFARKDAASKTLTKVFFDTMRRAGYSYSFDGTQYRFHALEIFSVEHLLDRLGKGIEISHRAYASDTRTNTMPLSRASWRYFGPSGASVGKELRKALADLSVIHRDANGLTDRHLAAAIDADLLKTLLATAGPYVRLNPRVMRDAQPFAGPVVEALAAHGVSLSNHVRIGQTVGHIAVLANAVDSMRVLFANVDRVLGARDSNGDTVVHYATLYGTPEMLDVVCAGAAPIDLDARNGAGQAPIHVAAQANAADAVRTLIANGASTAIVDRQGRTPLHVAAEHNADAVATILLDSGAAVDARDVRSATPLLRASEANAFETMPILISAGADSEARDNAGYRPLHAASASNAAEAVTVLMAHGADPNSVDKDQETPLHRAADRGALLAAHALLGARGRGLRARVDAPNEDGETALHLAAGKDSSELVGLLLANGADPEARDHRGNSPLHDAASAEALAALTVLADEVQNLDIRNRRGETPLAEAVGSCDGVPIARELVRRGASLDASDSRGRTPTDRMRRRGICYDEFL